jgi:hypothetical protein
MATQLPVEGRPSYSIPGDGIHIKDADVDNEVVGAVESLIGQDGSSYISRGKISMATLRPEMQNDNVSVEKAPRASRLCAPPQCQCYHRRRYKFQLSTSEQPSVLVVVDFEQDLGLYDEELCAM